MTDHPGTVYLLHITPSLHHAKHYVGWTVDADPARRVSEHLRGQGSPLIRAALAAGCTVDLVLAVPGDRGLERRWHNKHGHGAAICPRCKTQRPPRTSHRQLRLPFTRCQPAPLSGGRSPRPWSLAA